MIQFGCIFNDLFDVVQQMAHSKRFGHIKISTCVEASLFIALHGYSGECYDIRLFEKGWMTGSEVVY
jgi:hypothetical protein